MAVKLTGRDGVKAQNDSIKLIKPGITDIQSR